MRIVLVPLIIFLLACFEIFAYLPRTEAGKPLLGYNLVLKENVLTFENLQVLASRLGRMARAVKVWLPVNSLHARVLENGSYGGWDFGFWDSVLELLVKENLVIILDPWFRTTREFCPPDLTEDMLVMMNGKREWKGTKIPSVFHPRVRQFMREACEAIAVHYGKERQDISQCIRAFVLFCEPYFYTQPSIGLCLEGSSLPLNYLIDEDPNHIEQDFGVQVENLALFFRELRGIVRKHWDVDIMLVMDTMAFVWPPAWVEYVRLAKEADVLGVDPYPGNYEPIPWFSLELVLKRGLSLGKPLWITEWGYDALAWRTGVRKLPSLEFTREFIRRSSRKGVEGILYWNFFEFEVGGPIYSVYDPRRGELYEDSIELCETLKRLSEN
ncbi:MAG: hypothetical protein QXH26_01610 [Candidatus Hadarchaeales archaeon]